MFNQMLPPNPGLKFSQFHVYSYFWNLEQNCILAPPPRGLVPLMDNPRSPPVLDILDSPDPQLVMFTYPGMSSSVPNTRSISPDIVEVKCWIEEEPW